MWLGTQIQWIAWVHSTFNDGNYFSRASNHRSLAECLLGKLTYESVSTSESHLRTIHMKAIMDYVDSQFPKAVGNDHEFYNVSGLDDQEGDSEFLNDFRKAALMGYGSGLCVGLSIIYMVSTRNPIWLARIILKLENKIIKRRKKKQRLVRNNRRRNNRL
ncbi:hypothetical protein BC332_31562 [Capsicum chinense]|nr:hypothetical protein BC332_31562 [Capsicum chinense]